MTTTGTTRTDKYGTVWTYQGGDTWKRENGETASDSSWDEATQRFTRGSEGTASTSNSSSSSSDVSASDFASTSGLPDWGTNWIKGVVDKYGKESFSSLANSVSDLEKVPKNTEEGRAASSSAFTSSLQSELADTAKETARTLAGKGLSSSSIGAEYVAAMTKSALESVATQQEDVNQAAAETLYSNKKDQAEASLDVADLMKNYVGATKKSYGFDSTLDTTDDAVKEGEKYTGNWDDSSSSYAGASEWGSGSTLYTDEDGNLTTDPGWSNYGNIPVKTNTATNKKRFTYNGQTFDFNTETGEITSVSGSYKGNTEGSDVDASDLASTSGLRDWGESYVKDLVNSYGDKTISDASSAVESLADENFADTAKTKLDTQSDELSNLATAMTSAAGRSIVGNATSPSTSYQNVIDAVKSKAKEQATAKSTSWASALKNQQVKDVIDARGGLAGLIGNYLGLTNYTYQPNTSAYLSHSKT